MSDYTDYGHLLDPNPVAAAESDREAELVEWEREILADRLGRDVGARTWCVVCGVEPGRSVYGFACAGCFEARRAEPASEIRLTVEAAIDEAVESTTARPEQEKAE